MRAVLPSRSRRAQRATLTAVALIATLSACSKSATTTTEPPVVTTNASGAYAFNALTAGTYTVRATKVGFSDGTVIATISAATQTAPVLFMSPTGTSFAWRIVLSWGAAPRDLDSHLTGPLTGSTSRFHVYFPASERGSLTASPFAKLDVDVTTGYGPETITIAQQIAGVYRYYVYRYSSDGGEIKTSSARVDLYQGNALVRQFYPPLQDGRFWTVFELNGSTITTVNTINDVTPSVSASTSGPLRVRTTRAGDELRELMSNAPTKTRGEGGERP
jgi:hypothetical protein